LSPDGAGQETAQTENVVWHLLQIYSCHSYPTPFCGPAPPFCRISVSYLLAEICLLHAMSDDHTRLTRRFAGLDPVERRSHLRYPFTAAVQAVDCSYRSVLNARIGDIGRGGCYIDAFSPFPLKTNVRLRITREKRAFEAQAKVVFSKIGMGMGLQFTGIEPAQLHVLDKWLGELNGTDADELLEGESVHELAPRTPLSDDHCFELVERTLTMIRQGQLTNTQGRALLRNLLRDEPVP
jgi:hypothetical protein